nr:diaminobutyrate acetyltransferase [Nocardia donostiensis]
MSLQTLSTQTAGGTSTGSTPPSRGSEVGTGNTAPAGAVVLRQPRIADGTRIWEIAKDSQVLDVNSSYAYLLWCRDFAASSVVAEVDGKVVGFVTGYLRPESPSTLFVWQVAVDDDQRGRGLGVAMLDHLVGSLAASVDNEEADNKEVENETPLGSGVRELETTVSPDNTASVAMFASLARRRGAQMTKSSLFEPDMFPDSHAAEDLYHIAPIARNTERDH